MFFNTHAEELRWYQTGDFSDCFLRVYKHKADKFLIRLTKPNTKNPLHCVDLYSPEEVIAYCTKVCILQPHMYVDLRVDRGYPETDFRKIFAGLAPRIRETRWTYKKKPRQARFR